MRPEAPGRYRPASSSALGIGRLFGPPGRMVIRNIERQPVRTLTSIVGIAFAVVDARARHVLPGLDRRGHARAVHRGAAAGSHRRRSSSRGRRARSTSCSASTASSRSNRRACWRCASGPATASRQIGLIRRRPRSHGCSASSTRRTVPVPLPPSGLVLSRSLAELLGVGAGAVRATSRCSRAAARATRVQVDGAGRRVSGRVGLHGRRRRCTR